MNHEIKPKTLKTKRLTLRAFQLGDETQMFYGWCHDPRVTKTLYWETHQDISQTKAVLEMWLNQYEKAPYYHWGIIDHDKNQLIGSIGLVNYSDPDAHGEIGYCLAYDYWNQGIMTEAYQAIMAYLFEVIGFNKLYSKHMNTNLASGRVMIKCGMQKEGYLREDHLNKEGGFDDMILYAILKSDYFKLKRGQR